MLNQSQVKMWLDTRHAPSPHTNKIVAFPLFLLFLPFVSSMEHTLRYTEVFQASEHQERKMDRPLKTPIVDYGSGKVQSQNVRLCPSAACEGSNVVVTSTTAPKSTLDSISQLPDFDAQSTIQASWLGGRPARRQNEWELPSFWDPPKKPETPSAKDIDNEARKNFQTTFDRPTVLPVSKYQKEIGAEDTKQLEKLPCSSHKSRLARSRARKIEEAVLSAERYSAFADQMRSNIMNMDPVLHPSEDMKGSKPRENVSDAHNKGADTSSSTASQRLQEALRVIEHIHSEDRKSSERSQPEAQDLPYLPFPREEGMDLSKRRSDEIYQNRRVPNRLTGPDWEKELVQKHAAKKLDDDGEKPKQRMPGAWAEVHEPSNEHEEIPEFEEIDVHSNNEDEEEWDKIDEGEVLQVTEWEML